MSLFDLIAKLNLCSSWRLMPSHTPSLAVWFHGMMAAFIMVALLLPTLSWSAIITVRSTRDELNVDGDCSLREAIASANQDQSFDECVAGNGADVIEFASTGAPRFFQLNRPRNNNDSDARGDLNITADLTIRGQGEDMTIIQLGAVREAVERVFDIAPAGQAITVVISDLTITVADSIRAQGDHGDGIRNRATGTLHLERVTIRDLQTNSAEGSAVFNEGNLTLDQSSLIDNTGQMGGGILNRGRLTVAASTISGNRASGGFGGGIYNEDIAVIRASTLFDNRASRGGGIFNLDVMVLENSTLSGNRSQGAGGIDNQRVLTIRNSTITNNNGDTAAGGIQSDGVTQLSHTIIAGNTATSALAMDCSPSGVTSLGHNLVGLGTGCPNTGIGDRVVSGALVSTAVLSPLQDNGGPTATHALQPGSPAIDAGAASCPPIDVDQRDAPRPSDGNADGLSACDIGAVEAPPIPSAMQTVLVAGRANIASAGLGIATVTGCGEDDPGHLPPFIPIPVGATEVQLMATGEIMLSDAPSPTGPDGQITASTTYTGPDGIGALTAERRGFLAGVFAPDTPPALPAPPALDVAGQEEMQSVIASPPLQPYNVFYIGDGLNTASQPLSVQIPLGATRLFFGVVDACDGDPRIGSYDNNSGSWTVDADFVFGTP